MLNLLQAARPTGGRSAFAILRHFGAFGLFFLAILDSSPLPTLGGPDILIAILVSTRQNPWWEYVIVATAGSVIGAYLTFRLARKAGEAYLESKFGRKRMSKYLHLFERSGTGTLIASTAVPFPFPTSLVFAAAGVSDFNLGRFIVLVAACRAVRYASIALIADLYGRRFIRILRHPTESWGWLLLFTFVVLLLVGGGIFFNRRLATTLNSAQPSAST